MRRLTPVVLALVAVVLNSCRDPRAEANIAMAMTEVGVSMSQLQQDAAILQWQVDSLRQVVARQDTLIQRLASHVGLPLMPR